jgi:hypothetical protein
MRHSTGRVIRNDVGRDVEGTNLFLTNLCMQ